MTPRKQAIVNNDWTESEIAKAVERLTAEFPHLMESSVSASVLLCIHYVSPDGGIDELIRHTRIFLSKAGVS